MILQTDFDDKLKKLNKNELNELSKKAKAIWTKGLAKNLISKFSILNGTKYFSLAISQNYLVFIPAKRYIKYFSGFTWIDRNLSTTFVDQHLLPGINFNGHYLINNISIPKNVINLCISYTLNPWLRNLNTDFILKYCLFGSVKLTKNADSDK